MSKVDITNFAGGISEAEIDSSSAKVLHNIFLDQYGRPYKRDGFVKRSADPESSKIHSMIQHGYEVSGSKFDRVILDTTGKIKAWDLAAGFQDIDWVGGILAQLIVAGYSNPISDKAHIIYPTTMQSCPVKIFYSSYNNQDGYHAVCAGLQQATISATPLSGGDASYLYYGVLTREYKIGGVDYVDRGPPSDPILIECSDTDAANRATISFNPTLHSSVLYSFDWASVFAQRKSMLFIEIYRTTNGGTVPYRLAKLPLYNTTSIVSINDTGVLSSDSYLTSSADAIPLYIVGGYAPTGMPPLAKFACVTDRTAWYANSTKNIFDPLGANGSNVIRQSVPGDLDGVPWSFYYEVDSEITSMVSNDIYPIVFENNKVLRIEGQFNADGSGGGVKRLVSDRYGCPKRGAAINIGNGQVLFTGENQLYVTDGFNIKPHSGHISDLYRKMLRDAIIKTDTGYEVYSTHVVGTKSKKVLSFVVPDSVSNEGQRLLVDDKVLGLSQGVYTTAAVKSISGQPINLSYFFRPPIFTCGIEVNGEILLGTDQGVIVAMSPHSGHDNSYYDDFVNPGLQVADFPIVTEIETSRLSFGNKNQDKWMLSSRIITKPRFLFYSEAGINVGRVTGPTIVFKKSYGLPYLTTRNKYFLFVQRENGQTYLTKITNIKNKNGTIDVSPALPFVEDNVVFAIVEGNMSSVLDLTCKTDGRITTEFMRQILDVRQWQQATGNPITPYVPITPCKDFVGVFKRRFPKKRLRSVYKSLEIRSGRRIFTNSDDIGLMTSVVRGSNSGIYYVQATAPVALSGLLAAEQLTGLYGGRLVFENNGIYDVELDIIKYTSNVITAISYDNFTLNTAITHKWHIMLYDDHALPSIENIAMEYIPYGETYEPFAVAMENRNQ